MYVRTRVEGMMRVRTQRNNAHNNAEENFRDQKANHEIHENLELYGMVG